MLTLICGYSRAGKTTYSQQFDNVIHLDDSYSTQFVIQKVKLITEDVVVEGIYYRPQERLNLIHSYKGNGFRCICLDTSKEIRNERSKHKINHEYPFLIPTYDEGWDEIYIIKDNKEKYLLPK